MSLSYYRPVRRTSPALLALVLFVLLVIVVLFGMYK